MSAARRVSNTCALMPNPRAASWTAFNCNEPVVGSQRTPTSESVGTDSISSCRHFALKSGKSRNTPVTLPPGRARLLTKPLATGSLSRSIAITGMLVVAPDAAWTAGGPAATMTPTRLLTKSVASAGKRETSPSAIRTIRDFQPDCLGGREIYDQLELGRLQDRQVSRFFALEDATYIEAHLSKTVR